MIWWLLVGIAAVTAAFFYPPNSAELWPSLNSAGIAAAAYLVVFLLFTIRAPFRLRTRILILWSAFVVLGCIAANWILAERQGIRERASLSSVKSATARQTILSEIPDSLLLVLQKYYAQDSSARSPIGSIFRQTYSPAGEKSELFQSPVRDTAILYSLAVMTDTQVVVVAEGRYARGMDSLFTNAGGGKGGIQERYVLTVRGVHRETQN